MRDPVRGAGGRGETTNTLESEAGELGLYSGGARDP